MKFSKQEFINIFYISQKYDKKIDKQRNVFDVKLENVRRRRREKKIKNQLAMKVG